jgi:hypothetical protein
MFESATGKWTALPDMSTKRGDGPASCVVGGTKIIVAGGYDGPNYLATAEVFDFMTKKWTAIAPMREKRSLFSGVLLDDGVTFLVTGGHNGPGLASCEQLDTTKMMTWSAAPAMATARSNHCTVLYKKSAIVLGGHPATALCEEFDATARKWTPSPPLTQTRYYHCACVLNEKIFVCGGYVNGSISASVEVFDGVKWTVLDAALSATRRYHACVVWEGRVVVLGGDEEHIEVFDEAEKKWRSDVIPKMSTPTRKYLTAVSF